MLSNYPAGAEYDPSAPYNEPIIPEKDFDVTCSQSLSRTVTVWTDDYIPGASGVDYERDDEGGCYAVGWQDSNNTSDTDWANEYKSNGYKTPIELIGMLKEYLEKDLREIQKDLLPGYRSTQVRRLKELIEECEAWEVDETDFERD